MSLPNDQVNEYAPDASRLPVDSCENLCTKSMYIAMPHPDDIEENPGEGFTAAFWCALNQMPYGPDEEIVDPATCRPGRSCCTTRPLPRT